MGALFGSGSNNLPAKDQLPLGMDANRSASHQEGRVLPLIYGRQRVGCQFISDAFDIKVESVSTGGKQSTKAGTNYYASFAVAVCHGAVTKFHDLYLNGDPVFSSTTKLYSAHLSQSGNVATFQTRVAHGLTTGDTVNVFNCNQPEFNGQFTITVVSPTQFQYTIPGTSIPDETATAVSGKKIYCTVKLDPIAAAGDSTEITIPDFGTCMIYWGTETQTADAYLSGVSGIQHPPYKGICYIVFKQLFLGFNQTNVQNVEVVVERTPGYDWEANPANANINGDCNPTNIYADLLLNKRYGLGLDNTDVNLDQLATANAQFAAEEIGFSPVITRPEEIRSQLSDLLSMVEAAPVLDANGLLSLALQRTSTLTALTITEAELTDLPAMEPQDWSAVINETYINYTDRDAGWVADFVVWKDNSGFFAKNRAEPQTLDKPFITQKTVAQILTNIAGQTAALPSTQGKLNITFTADLYAALKPGAGFTFNYSPRENLFGIYRILKRTWSDPAKPTFEIEVAIDRSYLYTSSYYPADPLTPSESGGGGSAPVPAAVALPQPILKVIELPDGLNPGTGIALAVLLQRDQSSTTAAQVWLGKNYVFTGVAPDSFFSLTTLSKFALRGSLVGALAAAAAYTVPDNALPAEATEDPFPLVEGVPIQLDGPDLLMPDGISDFESLANTVLLLVGSELMSIATAELTAQGAYTLNVVRGRYGTAIADHASADEVWIIRREDIIALQHAHFVAGNTARFKVNYDWQSVSEVDAFDFAL